jgi:transcriptional regulator with XRE-family HTH domain
MKLSEYAKKHGVTLSTLAKELGTSVATISRHCSGKNIPKQELMRRIHELTGGEVTASDFYGLRDEEGEDTEVTPCG